MLFKMHHFRDYYALQYNYKKNYVLLVIEFGEGNKKKLRGVGKNQKIIYTPALMLTKKGIFLRKSLLKQPLLTKDLALRTLFRPIYITVLLIL